MASKLLILTFVLLSTTSGWAKSDNLKKYCPMTNSWVSLDSKTASIEQEAQNLKVVGSTGAISESKTVDPSNH